jgi:phosphoserine phosphatase
MPLIQSMQRELKLSLGVMGLVAVLGTPQISEARGNKWANKSALRHIAKHNKMLMSTNRHTRKYHNHTKPIHRMSAGQAPDYFFIKGKWAKGGRPSHTIPAHLYKQLSPKVKSVLYYMKRTGRKGPATFDGDGTLWAGDVGEGFFVWMLQNRYYPQQRIPMLEKAWKGYKKGTYDGEKFYELMVTSMAGMKETKVKRLATQYFRTVHQHRIYRPMVNLIVSLQRLGIEPWVVSGSPYWVVAAGARLLGIPSKRVIGLSVEVDRNGRLTDQVVRPVPWKHGKAKRILLDIKKNPVLAAGNSFGDIQMLKIASEYPMVVNPCPEAAQHAANNGWTVHRYTELDQVNRQAYMLPGPNRPAGLLPPPSRHRQLALPGPPRRLALPPAPSSP